MLKPAATWSFETSAVAFFTFHSLGIWSGEWSIFGRSSCVWIAEKNRTHFLTQTLLYITSACFLLIPDYNCKSQENIQWGKNVDPLLIFYVCPLTKKWSVYNFNGRFIWTVKDRITPKKSRKNAIHKSYTFICILMSQIPIWSLINQQDFLLLCVFYTGRVD